MLLQPPQNPYRSCLVVIVVVVVVVPEFVRTLIPLRPNTALYRQGSPLSVFVSNHSTYTVIFSHLTNCHIAVGITISSLESIYWPIAAVFGWIQSLLYIGRDGRQVNLCSIPGLQWQCLAPVNHCIISVGITVSHKPSIPTYIRQYSATRNHCIIGEGDSE